MAERIYRSGFKTIEIDWRLRSRRAEDQIETDIPMWNKYILAAKKLRGCPLQATILQTNGKRDALVNI